MHHVSLTSFLENLAYFALGITVSWALIGSILLRAAQRVGNSRAKDFHHGNKNPIPRLGGVALVTAFAVTALAVYVCSAVNDPNLPLLGAIVFTSLAMFGLGFWDDIRPLDARVKLLGQVGIASLAYASNIRIEMFKIPLSETIVSLGLLSYLATVIWLVGLTNLINLIDGIDGLAGGIGLMLMLLMADLGVADHFGFSSLLAVGVAGALLGFLKFNYPPAKIYMGDGGAYFLGFFIGLLSIVNSEKGTIAAALIAPAFALALPIVDVSLAILRRAARGLPIFRPDQKHIHHHLITLGISRERTLLNLYTVSLLCLSLSICVFCLQGRFLALYTGLLFLVLLIAGHLSGFTRNWYQITSQVGSSLKLRKETRYALTLDRWLVMEAERCASIEALWEDFRFVTRKLGFTRVELTLPDKSSHVWQAQTFDSKPGAAHREAHEISDGTTVDLAANRSVMPEGLFALLGDLAAETWYKAALRFRQREISGLELNAGRDEAQPRPPFQPRPQEQAEPLAELAES